MLRVDCLRSHYLFSGDCCLRAGCERKKQGRFTRWYTSMLSGELIPAKLPFHPALRLYGSIIHDYRLQLKFTGEKVSLACAAPVNFALDENKVFISTGIPLGGVASLCFVQKGEFKYKLIKMDQFGAPSTPERFSGAITDSINVHAMAEEFVEM